MQVCRSPNVNFAGFAGPKNHGNAGFAGLFSNIYISLTLIFISKFVKHGDHQIFGSFFPDFSLSFPEKILFFPDFKLGYCPSLYGIPHQYSDVQKVYSNCHVCMSCRRIKS